MVDYPPTGKCPCCGAYEGLHAFTDEQITKVAAALRDEAANFGNPVHFYVEPEALDRWERDNPGLAGWGAQPSLDWELESWKILARAASAALKCRLITAEGFAND